MSTVTREFHFQTSTEGWSATPGDVTVEQAWFHSHKKRVGGLNQRGHLSAPPLQTMGGCLRTTAKRNSKVINSNYWQWSGTWEDLDVPPGATVLTVKGDYIWRVDMKGRRPARHSTATWAAAHDHPCASGPFEYLDDSDVVLDQLSDMVDAPDRPDLGGSWLAWPLGAQTDLVSFMPPSWSYVEGSEIAVSAPQNVSNADVKFRLWCNTPPTENDIAKWVRLKQDYVVLTITYTTSTGSPGGWFFGG